MRSMNSRQQTTAPLVGIMLLAIGLGALALRPFGMDLGYLGGTSGWPLLVIVPGLILLASAIVPLPPHGLGLAIAGSIVTTVGMLLLYQQSTGNWATWAYAWALLPTAAGVAMTVYGSATRRVPIRAVGLRLAGVGALLFGAGFWFFETVFATGRAPFDMSAWWPVLPVVAGLALIARALVRRGDASPLERPSGEEIGGPS